MSEWENICQQYESMRLNEEGLKMASKGKYQKAIKCWKKASEMGNAKACFNLGLCYEIGTGTVQSLEKVCFGVDFLKVFSQLFSFIVL